MHRHLCRFSATGSYDYSLNMALTLDSGKHLGLTVYVEVLVDDAVLGRGRRPCYIVPLMLQSLPLSSVLQFSLLGRHRCYWALVYTLPFLYSEPTLSLMIDYFSNVQQYYSPSRGVPYIKVVSGCRLVLLEPPTFLYIEVGPSITCSVYPQLCATFCRRNRVNKSIFGH